MSMIPARQQLRENGIEWLYPYIAATGSISEGASFAMPWLKEQENPCRDNEQTANKGLTQKIIVSPIISMIINVLHEIWANKLVSP